MAFCGLAGGLLPSGGCAWLFVGWQGVVNHTQAEAQGSVLPYIRKDTPFREVTLIQIRMLTIDFIDLDVYSAINLYKGIRTGFPFSAIKLLVSTLFPSIISVFTSVLT